jgi:hypothetical protein
MASNTKFASAQRKSQNQVIEENKSLMRIPYLKEVLDVLPNLSAILNEERQAIYVNQNILDLLGIKDINDILGERPGEIFGCIHSDKEPGGCGTSENCRFCGAVNSIIEAQITKAKIIDECRISSIIGGISMSFDLEIIATPVVFTGKDYIVLTLNDISSLKRKEVLEKIFFHDILNLSHNLRGFIELIQDLKDPIEIKSFIDQISNMVSQLNDEILSQRELMEAEKGELAVDLSIINLREFLPLVIHAVSHHNSAIGKEIILNDNTIDGILQTDKALLTRVIVNMIKNALEAEPIDGTVYLGYKMKDGNLFIRVRNSSVIPDSVQLQIFQRSFSTKGAGRGIGTYSMKLICGQYLKADISFISNQLEGTIFTLKIPQHYPN